jgi:hypothetical protein
MAGRGVAVGVESRGYQKILKATATRSFPLHVTKSQFNLDLDPEKAVEFKKAGAEIYN